MTKRFGSSLEALQAVMKELIATLPTLGIKNYGFMAQFADDMEYGRVAYMSYGEVYCFKMLKGGWIFALGTTRGKSYLFDGMEADIILVRSPTWPIDERVLWELIHASPITANSKGNNFRFSFLASRAGQFLQKRQEDFDLTPWAQEKFSRNEKDRTETIKGWADRTHFSTFLPESTVFDTALAKSVAAQITEYMLTH